MGAGTPPREPAPGDAFAPSYGLLASEAARGARARAGVIHHASCAPSYPMPNLTRGKFVCDIVKEKNSKR